jgi:ribose/xylose/arabinose/galactoside ABC-type transport system permease subunit
MNADHESTAGSVLKIIAVIAAWFASWKLGDVQVVVAILSGLAVLAYTAVKTYFLIRNKGRE